MGDFKLRRKNGCGDGCVTLEKDLLGFESIGHLPPHISLHALNDGTGIANTLRENFAGWHKSCRDALNATKLSRAQKRKFSTLLESKIPAAYDSVENTAELPAVTRSASVSSACATTPCCFFCEKREETGQSDGRLWQVRTFTVDTRVRQCATLLGDFKLLSKLSEGDMIATEAKYHTGCLIAYYNRAQRMKCYDTEQDANIHGIVLAELVAYIEDIRTNQTIAPVFKLSELKKCIMYYYM